MIQKGPPGLPTYPVDADEEPRRPADARRLRSPVTTVLVVAGIVLLLIVVIVLHVTGVIGPGMHGG